MPGRHVLGVLYRTCACTRCDRNVTQQGQSALVGLQTSHGTKWLAMGAVVTHVVTITHALGAVMPTDQYAKLYALTHWGFRWTSFHMLQSRQSCANGPIIWLSVMSLGAGCLEWCTAMCVTHPGMYGSWCQAAHV
jgi:hypothetical protein